MILLPAGLLRGANLRDDMLGSMVSAWLPVAAGLLLSVQAGGLNLSVWGVASLAGVLTWALVGRGWPVGSALPLVLLAGALIGLAQAFLIKLSRLPMWLVTLIVGLAIAAATRAMSARLNSAGLAWEALAPYNMQTYRWLLSAVFYIAVLLSLLPRYRRMARKAEFVPPGWWGDHVIMVASGALAAGGGCLWTISEGGYVGSLIPEAMPELLAAVLLCGASSLRGQGGRILSALLLPVSLMIVRLWWMMVWDVGTITDTLADGQWWGLIAPVSYGVLILLGMVLAVIWLCRRQEPRWQWVVGTCGLAGLAVAVTAVAAMPWPAHQVAVLLRTGLIILSIAVAGGLGRSLWLGGRMRSGQAAGLDV